MSELIAKGHLFISKNADKLDPETKALITAKQIRFTEGDFYLRKKITGGSNLQQLLDETNEKLVGTTNLDKNYLPNKEHLALQKVGLRYATEALGVAVAAVDTWSSVKTGVPAALINGELTIVQEGKVLVRLPIARFFSSAASERLNSIEDMVELNALQLIKARTPIEINIEYAKGASVETTAEHFLEVRLIGDKTTAR